MKPTTTLPREYSEDTAQSHKISQIAHMIRQCFSILDTYGKTKEDLEFLMEAMILDLKGYSTLRIEEAFTAWRRENTKIPTPADIIKLVKEGRRKQAVAGKELKNFSDFGGDWQAYKKYLYENNLLNPKLVDTL